MDCIHTITGDIALADMGYTLAHEHIFVHEDGVISNFPQLWDRDAAILSARQKLTEAYNCGVQTILDMSVLGNGRNILDVQEAAKGLPIHIVAATGAFYPERLPSIFSANPIFLLKDCFVHDITKGISGTDVRASIIKVCTDRPGITPDVEKALRAAARAHLETGAPIHTHANAWYRCGLEQQRIFQEENVELRHTYIGHVMDSTDESYAMELLDNGSYIGFDRFASAPPHSEKISEAVKLLAKLCAKGYENQILIGNDGCAYQTVAFFDDLSLSSNGKNDYLVFTRDVVPRLLEAGITQNQIKKMTVDNPQRMFKET